MRGCLRRIPAILDIPSEGEAVVGRQADGVAARPIALQGMEVRPGVVHVLWPLGGFER